ncbi:MAG: type II toxin-antitoxin system PemK/MazF family toxin [Candidatus Omnitrophica bacterium]|nr:type II toxin-antitoxin system PemK/MazF family toxin [Candidatus Omnitrophota bacterium]
MVRKFHLYLVDLGDSFGAEPGKLRPVVVIQTDEFNDCHPTTMVCSLTTNIKPVSILRVHVPANNISGLFKDSDIMVDQIRSIDVKRIKKSLGRLNNTQSQQLLENLNILINE